MDFVTLKKKLSTYVSAKGYFTNVSDEVLYEVLVAYHRCLRISGIDKGCYHTICAAARLRQNPKWQKQGKVLVVHFFGEHQFPCWLIDD